MFELGETGAETTNIAIAFMCVCVTRSVDACQLYLRVAIIPVNVIVIIADGEIFIEMNISFLWLHRECPAGAHNTKLIVEYEKCVQ